MNVNLTVIDNFLSDEDSKFCRNNIDKLFKGDKYIGGNGRSEWSTIESLSLSSSELGKFVNKIINIYKPIKDLSWVKTVEYWTHILVHPNDVPDIKGKKFDRLDWHTNYNDQTDRTDTVVPPLSVIYYVEYRNREDNNINNVPGGWLEISPKSLYDNPGNGPGEVERIKTKTNRLVMFNPSYWHRVTNVLGYRYAVSIDLWNITGIKS